MRASRRIGCPADWSRWGARPCRNRDWAGSVPRGNRALYPCRGCCTRRAARGRQGPWREGGAPASEPVVRAVAEGLGARPLAAAEPDLLCRGYGERRGRDAGAAVRAVAERLRFAAAAGAPPIFALGFDGDGIRALLRRDRLAHLALTRPPRLYCRARSTRRRRAELYATAAGRTRV